MALTYPWKVMRGDPLSALEVKTKCGEARTETWWPVGISANTVIKANAEGQAICGVAPNAAVLNATTDVVIIDDDIVYEVQLKTGENPNLWDYVMISDGADGSVAVGAAPDAPGTNYACGQVVDYDPASGGLCHIVPIFHAGTVSWTKEQS